MIHAYYELGASGRESCISCETFDQLLVLAPHLPPGRYWIGYVVRIEGYGPEDCRTSEDWGVLTVATPEDWRLESLSGITAGPGYVVA